MELLKKSNGSLPRTQEEINNMIDQAEKAYGEFLTAVGFDYKARNKNLLIIKKYITPACVN